MTRPSLTTQVAIIGGGVVGAALLQNLTHRGIDTILLEARNGLAYAASGTNSGILHTGFDSTPGELETELILRAASLRPALLAALDVPVAHCGARLVPKRDEDLAVIQEIAAGAERNGVDVEIRSSDGALLVPGEAVTDPVAFTHALAASGVAAGGRIETRATVVAISEVGDRLHLALADGRVIETAVAINAAGLHADEVARLIGDHSFSIYPRKGEFFVFELPQQEELDHILLPVPTKRTKGVLVFPTLDGRVVAGPTAHDQDDKSDWSVRPTARNEILPKAYAQFPALEGLAPIFSYAGLRPAGRDANYVIGSSAAQPRLINVAAIRSTGLTASLGIADHVAGLLPALGVEIAETREAQRGEAPVIAGSWWRRTAEKLAISEGTRA